MREGGSSRAIGPTSAKRLQRQSNPLLVRACTSEWLPPCFQEHLHRPRERNLQNTMHQDVLGRQQAGTTAALQRGLEKRHRHYTVVHAVKAELRHITHGI